MPLDTLSALAAYAVATLWTPGPNNMMLAASGATFGWRRTQRHAMGVVLGFSLMMFAIALGLGEAFEHSAALRAGLTWAGLGAMLYLAWRTAAAGPASARPGIAKPLSFVQAATFQWVNPKAWVMAIGVAATYVSGLAPVREAAAAAALFLVLGIGSSQGWTLFGAGIGKLLGSGWRLRAFNVAMGLLIALSAVWLVLE